MTLKQPPFRHILRVVHNTALLSFPCRKAISCQSMANDLHRANGEVSFADDAGGDCLQNVLPAELTQQKEQR